jgi:hypothetical protein
MSLDLQKILESKRALRKNLAARPVAEKLRMLDALRERELAIRRTAAPSDSNNLREEPPLFLSAEEAPAKADRAKPL